MRDAFFIESLPETAAPYTQAPAALLPCKKPLERRCALAPELALHTAVAQEE